MLMQAKEYHTRLKTDVESKIKLQDLVLIKYRPADLLSHVYRDCNSTKLIPSWSLPARVEWISKNHQRLNVRFLVSGGTRTVHRTEVKIIGTPKDTHQSQMWTQQFEAELRRRLDRSELTYPQAKKLRSLRSEGTLMRQ